MHIAIAITLVFAGFTSALGGRNNGQLADKTGLPRFQFAAAVGYFMAAWCCFCAYWLFRYGV